MRRVQLDGSQLHSARHLLSRRPLAPRCRGRCCLRRGQRGAALRQAVRPGSRTAGARFRRRRNARGRRVRAADCSRCTRALSPTGAPGDTRQMRKFESHERFVLKAPCPKWLHGFACPGVNRLAVPAQNAATRPALGQGRRCRAIRHSVARAIRRPRCEQLQRLSRWVLLGATCPARRIRVRACRRSRSRLLRVRLSGHESARGNANGGQGNSISPQKREALHRGAAAANRPPRVTPGTSAQNRKWPDDALPLKCGGATGTANEHSRRPARPICSQKRCRHPPRDNKAARKRPAARKSPTQNWTITRCRRCCPNPRLLRGSPEWRLAVPGATLLEGPCRARSSCTSVYICRIPSWRTAPATFEGYTRPASSGSTPSGRNTK
jgi:hypothetical protein